MTLLDATKRLFEIDSELTLYARQPWTPSSMVLALSQPDDGSTPEEAVAAECEYFLEVFIAVEVLEGWREHVSGDPSMLATCSRLIQYAINDA